MEGYETTSLDSYIKWGCFNFIAQYFLCFFSKVKKDLTVVQAKYVPNPEKDQLTVLKVAKYDHTSTNKRFNLDSYHDWLLKHMALVYLRQFLCSFSSFVGLTYFSGIEVWSLKTSVVIYARNMPKPFFFFIWYFSDDGQISPWQLSDSQSRLHLDAFKMVSGEDTVFITPFRKGPRMMYC